MFVEVILHSADPSIYGEHAAVIRYVADVWGVEDRDPRSARHLDCLACSTTLDDAIANVQAAILATRGLSGMASVRATLTDALREIGVRP